MANGGEKRPGNREVTGRHRARIRTEVEPILQHTMDLPAIGIETTNSTEYLVGVAPLRLSRRQMLLWLQATLHKNTSTLERLLTIDFDRVIDAARFSDAFAKTVLATPSLRLVIEEVGTTPEPIRRTDVANVIVVHDVAPESWDADLEDRLASPLMLDQSAYASLLYVGPSSSRWCFRVHSIVSDLWSIRPFAARVAAAYRGAHITVDHTFDSFLTREHAYHQSAADAEDAKFWSDRLDREKETPIFYGHVPTRDALDVHRTQATLDREAVTALGEVARRAKVPAGLERMPRALPLLATAVISLLSRITGAERIGLGVPLDVRNKDGIGPMKEVCPIEVDIDPSETFATLLDKVLRELQITAPRARHSIDNRFGYLTYDAVLNLVDLRFEPFDYDYGRVSISSTVSRRQNQPSVQRRDFASLALQVTRFRGGHLQLEFELAEDAFGPDQRRRLPEHFVRILSAVSASLDTVIKQVDLLAPDERDAFAPEQVPTVPSANDGVVPTILRRAESTPTKVAVAWRDGSLDYATLVRRASSLAHHLRAAGVQAETTVAFCLDRTEDLPVAMFAIALAGGAFVAIDPTHPRARTSLILEDAHPQVLLTQRHHLADIQAPANATVLCIEDLPAQGDASAEAFDEPTPEQLAYVIYTSGSTGKPKGVEIEHGSLTNLLLSMASKPGLSSEDRLLAVTTPTFDIAILELYLPLFVGGTVVIADEAACADPPALAAWIDRHDVTTMQATPATWRALLASGWSGDQRLKIMCGGEALPPDLAMALCRCGREVWNLYGPTETTIWSAVQRIDESHVDRIPIGAPLDRTELYIADEDGRLLPDGVLGELRIGGVGLARGYHNRPALTAERFEPHPFDTARNVYRTGDLARRLRDGTFECLGRLDDQVKVRGHRVELSEIEVGLRQHESVNDAAVVVHRHRPDDHRLAAYIVTSDRDIDGPALRDHLRAIVPDYMIPSSFAKIDALPLTPNGKLNRRALRPIVEKRPVARQVVRPRSDLELQIAMIWRDVLEVDEVGVQDRFFDLGGHSLDAVAMLGRVRDALDCSVSVASFFEHPTVESLAESIDGQIKTLRRASVVALERGGTATPLFLVCGLQLYQNLATSFRGVRPVYGVLSPAEVELLASAESAALPDVVTLASQYVDAVRGAHPDGPYAIGGVSFGGLLAFEVAHQLRRAGAQVQTVVLLDAILGSAIKQNTRRWLATQLQRVIRIDRRQRSEMVRLDELRTRTYEERAEHYEQIMAPYDGDVVVVRARDNRDFERRLDDDLGWGCFVRGRLDVYEAAGDHLGILDAENAPKLAEMIAPHLDPKR